MILPTDFMMIGFWIVAFLVLLAILILAVVYFLNSRRRLSASATERIRSLIDRADQTKDPVLRIMEYDKVLDQLLHDLGFEGSTGEKLMKGGARFSNKDALWTSHKLRNILAHEHGATATEDDADRFRRSLYRAFEQVMAR